MKSLRLSRIPSIGAALAAILAATFALAQAPDPDDGFRTFTNREGREVTARIESKTDIAVTLRLDNGRVTTIPVTDLSDEDQDFVRRWDPLQEQFRQEFHMLSVRQLLEARGYQSFEYYIEGNHIFVDGELNGHKMRFMIDTGAGTSLFDVNAARAADCEVGEMTEKVYGIGGEAPAAVTKFKSIKVGDALIENRKLLAADLFKDIPNPDRSYGAIFGADFLRELNAVISYRESRVFLKPE